MLMHTLCLVPQDARGVSAKRSPYQAVLVHARPVLGGSGDESRRRPRSLLPHEGAQREEAKRWYVLSNYFVSFLFS